MRISLPAPADIAEEPVRIEIEEIAKNSGSSPASYPGQRQRVALARATFTTKPA